MAELERENAQLQAQLATVQQQLDWFKRQLFGAKSEKRLDVDPAVQADLLSALGVAAPPPPPGGPSETISYHRRPKARDATVNDTGLRFGDEVPREVIAVTDPEVEVIPAERRVRIGEKVTYRLAVTGNSAAYFHPRVGRGEYHPSFTSPTGAADAIDLQAQPP